MTASNFITATAAFSVAGVTIAAAVGHLAGVEGFSAALRKHRVWPPRLVRLIAVGVAAVEAAVAAFVIVALVGAPTAVRLAFVAAAALYVAYTSYSGYLHRRRPGVDCGCSRAAVPLTVWVPLRAGAFAGGAVVVAALPTAVLSPATSATGFVICALAAGTLALAVWYLPEAMSVSAGVEVLPQ